MTAILVSLIGAEGKGGALGVFEPGRGLRYVQVEAANGPVRSAGLRGVAAAGGRIYAATQASLRIHAVDGAGLRFPLEREVLRPDWVLGGLAQSDLRALAVGRERIYIGNNRLCAIDELTPDGEFVRRRHLWEIAPEAFPLPSAVGRDFRFAKIRGLCLADDDRLLLTLADCNESEEGMIVDGDSGKVVLGGLNRPATAACAAGRLYVIDVDGRELKAYRFAPDGSVGEAEWTTTPSLPGRYAPAAEGMRGIAACGDAVWCGVGNFRLPIARHMASSIVGFDAASGVQRDESLLTDLREFRSPKVYYMAALPDGFALPEQDTVMYAQGQPIAAEPWLAPDGAADALPPPVPAEAREMVIVQNAGVRYRRQARSGLGGNGAARDFWALRNVSFTLREGETVGIIGGNGSGKSTLCMLLAGTMDPDEGTAKTHGRAQLLSLGVGFQVELTGRENVYISGTLLGLTRRQVAEQMDRIIEFSELGEFIDEPVRIYSAGMRGRLGFAVASVLEPEILVIDEAMTPGDQSFSSKAGVQLEAMRAAAKTIVIVSHNLYQLRRTCTRLLWLERGRLLMDASPKKVLKLYGDFSKDRERWLARRPEFAAMFEPVADAPGGTP